MPRITPKKWMRLWAAMRHTDALPLEMLIWTPLRAFQFADTHRALLPDRAHFGSTITLRDEGDGVYFAWDRVGSIFRVGILGTRIGPTYSDIDAARRALVALAAQVEDENEWLTIWRLMGEPHELPYEMLATIPERAFVRRYENTGGDAMSRVPFYAQDAAVVIYLKGNQYFGGSAPWSIVKEDGEARYGTLEELKAAEL